eukprot:TRINITY_DN14200_c0_g1_i1.p1 TRINITY_DN14200_c0_g1~~TRINITY_DN14200_c0_g1_i1.p1  ORF type:complete len:152 (+),score=2.77 TRINITY_DN14200_c0_g1_i1:46-501(+)
MARRSPYIEQNFNYFGPHTLAHSREVRAMFPLHSFDSKTNDSLLKITNLDLSSDFDKTKTLLFENAKKEPSLTSAQPKKRKGNCYVCDLKKLNTMNDPDSNVECRSCSKFVCCYCACRCESCYDIVCPFCSSIRFETFNDVKLCPKCFRIE